jgi:hypothetical protein
LIGVDEKTIRNDGAENSAPIQEKSQKINESGDAPAEFSALAELDPDEDNDACEDDQMSPKEIARAAG